MVPRSPLAWRLASALLPRMVAAGGPLATYGGLAWLLHDAAGLSPTWACLAGGAMAVATARLWELPGELGAPSRRLRPIGERARRQATLGDLETFVVSALLRLYQPTHVSLWLPPLGEETFHLAAGLGRFPGSYVLPDFVLRPWREQGAAPAQLLRPSDEPNSAFEELMNEMQVRVAVPLIAHDRLVGVITLGRRRSGRAYLEIDRRALTRFGVAIAEAILPHQLKAEQELHRSKFEVVSRAFLDAQRRAVTDGLTGLSSHPHFKDQLAKRFCEARRFDQPLSLMFLDADFFKSVNDTYGHLTGDEVLKALAATVQSGARTCDTVARYGGEELAMLLPQTDLAGATILAERLRQAISELVIDEVGGPRQVRVTASIGVAQLVAEDLSPADLLDRADQALYVAKRSGRNQVIQSALRRD